MQEIHQNPNFGTHNTSPRYGKIEYIVIHYVGATGGAEANVKYYNQPTTTNASADFFVGHNGEIWQYNPDPQKRYCWAVGGRKQSSYGGTLYGIATNANCVNIEMCVRNSNGDMSAYSDGWYFEEATVNSTVDLTNYLMQKYGIDANHVIRHFTVNGKYCPSVSGWIAPHGGEAKWNAFKARLTGSAPSTEPVAPTNGLENLTEAQIVAKIGPLCTSDMEKSGVLASITAAQFILESGYGKSELAVNANNYFGMKTALSGNTWANSTWDGKSVYIKKTREEDASGNVFTITASFRKYPTIVASIADHSAYLLGAKNGNKLRYEGLKGCTDYKKAANIIKNGGYATGATYVNELCSIIEKWNLTQYDVTKEANAVVYRVRKTWADAASQIGAFSVYENAKAFADAHPGYAVFDESGKKIYGGSGERFLVYVDISNLRIRKGPGTNYDSNGYTGKGIFTIVETQNGQGSDLGWGKLLSGAGWISLDFVTKI